MLYLWMNLTDHFLLLPLIYSQVLLTQGLGMTLEPLISHSQPNLLSFFMMWESSSFTHKQTNSRCHMLPHSLSATTMDLFQVQNKWRNEGVLSKKWGLEMQWIRGRMDNGNGLKVHTYISSSFAVSNSFIWYHESFYDWRCIHKMSHLTQAEYWCYGWKQDGLMYLNLFSNSVALIFHNRQFLYFSASAGNPAHVK